MPSPSRCKLPRRPETAAVRIACLSACLLALAVQVASQPREQRASGGSAAAGSDTPSRWATAVQRPSPIDPQIDSDPQAIATADRVMAAMGGRMSWDLTRHVTWNFFGSRRHYWDKWTNDVRIEHEDLIILMNLDTRRGRAQQADVEVTGADELAEILERGHAWWVNDSYWMFMPYKLRDPGVHLASGGTIELPDGRVADLLTLTFEEVGITPRNRYDVAVARDTWLIEQWSFYADRDDEESRFTLPWAGWQEFDHIMLATQHGRGKSWEIGVHQELPAAVYRGFAPVVIQ